METKNVIIYHNNCPDGWCAAYIAKKRFPDAELIPLNHGLGVGPIQVIMEQCFQKDVLMVDYSLRTRELNDELDRVANSFHILDHHKSAREVLEGANYATFDMKRSGAGLAWDYLFGFSGALGSTDWNPADPFKILKPQERPWWVNYTEDQDLWNWKLENSQTINAFLSVQPRNIETWDKLTELSALEAANYGVGVRQYIEYYTRSVVAELQEGVFVFEGRNYRTGVVNIPYAGVSEAGADIVKKGYDIGLAWFERGDGLTQFSLRSEGDLDVSKIAKSFGGGGHVHAAGFQISVQAGRDLVDWILGRVINIMPRCV